MQPDFEHDCISKQNEAKLGQLTTRDSPVCFLRFGGCLHGYTAANRKSILYCCNHIIISIITSTLQSGALNSAV